MKNSSARLRSVESRSTQFLQLAAAYDAVTVMAHDNPDPDGLSSGWAMVELVRARLQKTAVFLAGGTIARAENRKMVALLRPPIELNRAFEPSARTLLVMVDCDVTGTNHPAVDPALQPVAVIDHHVETASALVEKCVFRDLRADVASTAAIAASYLREQEVEPSEDLATALVYGIRTEASGGETHYSRLDRAMLTWVTGLCNPSQVAQIEDATLAAPYFTDLALAIQNTALHGNTAFCVLPQCQGPEAVGEIADLLLRCESVSNVFCGAIYRRDLVVSIRSDDPGRNAARDVILLLAGLGNGGGHPHRAGGIIRAVGQDTRRIQELFAELRRRWLEICGVADRPETRLLGQ